MLGNWVVFYWRIGCVLLMLIPASGMADDKEPDSLPLDELVFNWMFDVDNGFDRVMRHSRISNDYVLAFHFFGRKSSEMNGSALFEILAGMGVPPQIINVSPDGETTTNSKENIKKDLLKVLRMDGKTGFLSRKQDSSFFVFYDYMDHNEFADAVSLIRKERGRVFEATDDLSVGDACTIIRDRENNKIVQTFIFIESDIGDDGSGRCIHAGVFAHFGFSNTNSIYYYPAMENRVRWLTIYQFCKNRLLTLRIRV